MEHLLLDWINTIEEPRCMVLNKLDDLRDGVVVLYIVSSMLRKIGREKDIKLELSELERLSAKEKFDHVFSVLSSLFKGTVLEQYFSFQIISSVSSILN